MTAPVFKGNVFKHPAYVQLETRYPELHSYTSAFRIYWLEGYHPMVGKDYILDIPDVYVQNAIGHAHVEPLVKNPISYTSTDACWKAWQAPDSVSPTVPTSNSFLMYCVDEHRNACLLGYLDGGDRDSHEVIKTRSFRTTMELRAGSFYNRVPRSSPMQPSEHGRLFGEEWLV